MMMIEVQYVLGTADIIVMIHLDHGEAQETYLDLGELEEAQKTYLDQDQADTKFLGTGWS